MLERIRNPCVGSDAFCDSASTLGAGKHPPGWPAFGQAVTHHKPLVGLAADAENCEALGVPPSKSEFPSLGRLCRKFGRRLVAIDQIRNALRQSGVMHYKEHPSTRVLTNGTFCLRDACD